MEKIDFKKEYRDLYLPPKKPGLIEVPKMNFLMVDGQGEPQSDNYQEAVGLLYAVAFTIKMSKMGDHQPEGYQDFVVPPLEGLWDIGSKGFDPALKAGWKWTSLLRMPEFVTPEVYRWAVRSAEKKKGDQLDFTRLRFESFQEGLCVQTLYIGPYEGERPYLDRMTEYAASLGYADVSGTGRRHHEIYLSDPRRTDPQRLKTVLRHPVETISGR